LTDMPAPRRSLADMIHADTVKSSISAVFMVLVGLSMPSLFNDKHDTAAHRRLAGSSGSSETMEAWEIAVHVLACSVLMNIGKLFPATCYRDQVSLRTRIALAVAMMPRGEVCAGIIVNALALGIKGPAMTIAVFCLACNMMMVSFFIFIVKKLTAGQMEPSAGASMKPCIEAPPHEPTAPPTEQPAAPSADEPAPAPPAGEAAEAQRRAEEEAAPAPVVAEVAAEPARNKTSL